MNAVFQPGLGNVIGLGPGLGIQPQFDGSGVLIDPLYDPLSEAFLFGQVDFTVEGEGFAELFLDQFNFINSGVETFPTTAGVTITTVPEPGSFMIAFVAAMLVIPRYRRRAL